MLCAVSCPFIHPSIPSTVCCIHPLTPPQFYPEPITTLQASCSEGGDQGMETQKRTPVMMQGENENNNNNKNGLMRYDRWTSRFLCSLPPPPETPRFPSHSSFLRVCVTVQCYAYFFALREDSLLTSGEAQDGRVLGRSPLCCLAVALPLPGASVWWSPPTPHPHFPPPASST